MSSDEKFINACLAGDLDIVEACVKNGADVNKVVINGMPGVPLVACFSEESQYHIACFLLENGADINLDGWPEASLLTGEIIKSIELYEQGATETPETVSIEFLISYGIDLNKTDENGFTPLDWSIKKKHFNAEKLLRKLGAKTGLEIIKDEYEEDPQALTELFINQCKIGKYYYKVKQYLEFVDPNFIDKDGLTPICLSINNPLYNNTDISRNLIVNCLLEKGANLNQLIVIKPGLKDIYENIEKIEDIYPLDNNIKTSLLHLTVLLESRLWKTDQSERVKFLVEKGIDLNITDSLGQTAQELAIRTGHDSASLLKV